MNNGTFNPYFLKLDFHFIFLPFLLSQKFLLSAWQNRHCPELWADSMVFLHSYQVPLWIQFLGGLIVFLSLVTSHMICEALWLSPCCRGEDGPVDSWCISANRVKILCEDIFTYVMSEDEVLHDFLSFTCKQTFWSNTFGIKSNRSNTESNYEGLSDTEVMH